MDEKGLKKVQDQHRSCLASNHQKAKNLLEQKLDYEALFKRLEHITDKSYYNVMVPFGGSKAFFEGQVEHTNEIMVLLGDNWFVERSAKEAREICQRRIDRCQSMIDDLAKESKLYQSWLQEESKFSPDGTQEIIEEYDEEKENDWRVAHRERVKAEKLANLDEHGFVDDEDLWQRLDELELEEELEAHLEKQRHDRSNEKSDNIEAEKFDGDGSGEAAKSSPKSILKKSKYSEDSQGTDEPETRKATSFAINNVMSEAVTSRNLESDDKTLSEAAVSEVVIESDVSNDESDEDWSESPPLTSDSEEEEVESGQTKRSVSFGNVSERLFSHEQDFGQISREHKQSTTKIIEFEHETTSKTVQASSSSQRPNHPGELVDMFSAGLKLKPAIKSPKKSILKKSKYSEESHASFEPAPPTPKKAMTFATNSAVSEVVIERSPQSIDKTVIVEKPKTQKISRFRATRIHQ